MKTIKEQTSLKQMIDKYDSNWFYCQCKSLYGNDVIDLLEEVVADLKDVQKTLRAKRRSGV